MCVERIALQQVPQGQFQPHKEWCHKLQLTQVRLQSQPIREISNAINDDSENKSKTKILKNENVCKPLKLQTFSFLIFIGKFPGHEPVRFLENSPRPFTKYG